jgi:lysophospholipase L1-like esterase
MQYKAQPGLKIKQLISFQAFEQAVEQYQDGPQLVIVDIGTNDLDNIVTEVEAEGHAQIKRMIAKLFLFARKLVFKRRVQHVVFLQVLPRCNGKFQPNNIKFPHYVNMYNAHIKSLCAKQHPKQRNVHYWAHPRMQANVRQLLADGVHLNRRGLKKYFHSLKQAVARYAALC